LSGRPRPAPSNVQPLFEREQLPDGALVLAAQKGEPWAQEALFRRYVPIAFRQAWRLLPHEDPEDLAQEALVKALTNLQRLEVPQAFAAWLSTIVVRLATSKLRKRRVLERLGLRRAQPIDVEAIVAEGEQEASAELREVYGRLAGMPAEERVALVLQRVEGLELTEIAERMGLSLATVKRRLSAASSKLGALHG
jgi:RNA polymerase sigma-70 factor (ECF subfamily)